MDSDGRSRGVAGRAGSRTASPIEDWRTARRAPGSVVAPGPAPSRTSRLERVGRVRGSRPSRSRRGRRGGHEHEAKRCGDHLSHHVGLPFQGPTPLRTSGFPTDYRQGYRLGAWKILPQSSYSLVVVVGVVWLVVPWARRGARRAAKEADRIRPPRTARAGGHEWDSRRDQLTRKVKGIGGPGKRATISAPGSTPTEESRPTSSPAR